jgi:hypothetical protein
MRLSLTGVCLTNLLQSRRSWVSVLDCSEFDARYFPSSRKVRDGSARGIEGGMDSGAFAAAMLSSAQARLHGNVTLVFWKVPTFAPGHFSTYRLLIPVNSGLTSLVVSRPRSNEVAYGRKLLSLFLSRGPHSMPGCDARDHGMRWAASRSQASTSQAEQVCRMGDDVHSSNGSGTRLFHRLFRSCQAQVSSLSIQTGVSDFWRPAARAANGILIAQPWQAFQQRAARVRHSQG